MLAQREIELDGQDLVEPVVIVGSGPVGVHLANELHRRAPDLPIVIYGAERWSPYNRVRLSSALAGEASWLDLMSGTQLPDAACVETRLGAKVLRIDREQRCIIDAQNIVQPYSFLVLATGSAPHMPGIEGIDLAGVYVFRDMDNVMQLAARRARTRRTVVLGGGLLGIEAARAMQRFNTEVFIVEHADRLMPRQLDAAASAALKLQLESIGIQVVLNDGAARIGGNTRVETVMLHSGQVIACDTVVVATGIRPNIDLALRAKLNVGRGVRVDDSMRTSDACIFAVGECAEHRDQIYGLVAPGLEQAAVAAHVITGGDVQYTGSNTATRLKVLNSPVFSMGEIGAEQLPDMAHELVYAQPAQNIYRKLVLRHGRIIGALALGNWDDITRVQEAVTQERRIWPWQRWTFLRDGCVWPASSAQQVQAWPANTVVCHCTGVTRGRLSDAMSSGCGSVAELSSCTGAASVCGSCKPLLQQLLGSAVPREPVPAAGKLWAIASLAVMLSLIFLLLPGLPYAGSVSSVVHWDVLWRDNLAKQISGYSLLVLSFALAVLGLRKRIQQFAVGDYAVWRLIHTVVGVSVLLGFVLHTGGHMGVQLNFFLALSFVGAALAGGVLAALVAREHIHDPLRVRQLKTVALWAHIIFIWPLPVLLAFHIAQGYVF